ncbi:MAG: DUF1178 family protein [Methylibium sp.]|uniref:DUF1178 family protein n=1 Tax=Methylibium sp. TaxID=2067992 RepID=UPI0017B4A8AA|nr:DUF1178 family protein [Methylibium sp.]MBA3599010.1 DUF1178 family protein [Methylibium sp.]
MKVLDLLCDAGHAFEGWFGSEDDYSAQCERGLVECPLCASRLVSRLPSAPRLNLSAARGSVAVAAPSATPEQHSVEALWLRAVRHVMAQTEDVGERFPDEARRIHYGEVPTRGIRGRASGEQAQALRDEGIEVQSVVLPEALKGTVQ